MKKLILFVLVLLSVEFTACEQNGPSNDASNGGSNSSVILPPTDSESPNKPENPINSTIGISKGHNYVDLGLSVKWATMNVGAESIEDYGDYYAWGEVQPKNVYGISSYKWSKNNQDSYIKYNDTDNKTTLELSDDAASVIWGGAWRIPTVDEQKELQSKCTWTWAKSKGVYGYLVTGMNGNSIFLPAGGVRIESDIHKVGEAGYYWCRSRDINYHIYAYYSSFAEEGYDSCDSYIRYFGHLIRPVLP